MINFVKLRKWWDGVGDVFIRTPDERKDVARILRNRHRDGFIVRCYPSIGPRILIAYRRPRIFDYMG